MSKNIVDNVGLQLRYLELRSNGLSEEEIREELGIAESTLWLLKKKVETSLQMSLSDKISEMLSDFLIINKGLIRELWKLEKEAEDTKTKAYILSIANSVLSDFRKFIQSRERIPLIKPGKRSAGALVTEVRRQVILFGKNKEKG